MTTTEYRINKAFAELPSVMADKLKNIAPSFSFIPAALVEELSQYFKGDRQQLGLALLPLASAYAVAPVSQFYVGAVAFDSDGNAYLGANFEFPHTHIGQTMHAEQSVIANAWSKGAKELSLLVINYAPCGHCRQFINEVNVTEDFLIVLPNTKPLSLSDFLPYSFGPNDLNTTEHILEKHYILTPSAIKNADIELLAHNACFASHAPYSNCNSGVAVEFSDGEIIVGLYAENAAFNPSLPPLQMALNYRRLQGKDWKSLEKVIMVENSGALSQKANTQLLIDSIALDNKNIAFEYYSIS